MVTQLVVDTSVAFKWIASRPEAGAADAAAILDSHLLGDVLITAPVQLMVEAANILRYDTDVSDDQIPSLIERLRDLEMDLLPVTTERLIAAAALARRHRLSVYDALFLQLAQELGCPLVTADLHAFKGLDCGVEIRLI